MRKVVATLLLLSGLALLNGCGMKGDLELPPEAALSVPEKTG